MMSKDEVAKIVGASLKEGYDYDESLQFGGKEPDSDGDEACREFFESCENGVDKFEAFVKAFF